MAPLVVMSESSTVAPSPARFTCPATRTFLSAPPAATVTQLPFHDQPCPVDPSAFGAVISPGTPTRLVPAGTPVFVVSANPQLCDTAFVIVWPATGAQAMARKPLRAIEVVVLVFDADP